MFKQAARKHTRITHDSRPATSGDPEVKVTAVFIGLLAAQFVASMSNTIISNAMPVIVAQIGANAVQYTWVITVGILANTILTPIAGKLADLYDKKKLFIFSLALFGTASLLSGASQTPTQLIASRVLQGAGMGMMITLTVVIMATIVSPRERGKFNGYMSASMAVSTVAGPLIGGLIVDSFLGWRWCFWIAVPFVIATIIVVMRLLKIPVGQERSTKVHIDFLGIALIGAVVTSALVWISSEGRDFTTGDPVSMALIGVFVISLVLFVVVESKVSEPLIPLHLFRNRTVVLSLVNYVGQGAVMFSTAVFFGQYFQYGRSYSPSQSGLLTLPMTLAMMLAATVIGRRTTATGWWKRYVVGGMVSMVVGALLFLPVNETSSLIYVSAAMVILGAGMGASGTLMVAVQNIVPLEIMGATSSTVLFFRTLSGALAIQVFGRVMQSSVQSEVVGQLGAMPTSQSGTGSLDFSALPPAAEHIVRTAYGNALAPVMAVMAGILVISLIATTFIKGTSLRTTIDFSAVEEALAQDSEPLPQKPRVESCADGDAEGVSDLALASDREPPIPETQPLSAGRPTE